MGQNTGAVEVGFPPSGSESPDTTTWSRSSGLPVEVAFLARVVYNPGGDKTIYSFTRTLQFDATGALVAVTPEQRTTVALTETCP